MMKVPFEKFSSCGNNFVLVDETLKNHIPESNKGNFARHVTDINFGIGSDGFIVLQPCNAKILSKINDTFLYWKNIPPLPDADYIFRLFEPNGQESFCCGNGLMCVASYLYQTRGITFSRILTEIPNKKFVMRTIGYDESRQNAWADMGTPGKVPSHMVDSQGMDSYDPVILKTDFDIPLHHMPSITFPIKQPFALTGHLIFTGEPHLVFLIGSKSHKNPSATGMCLTQNCISSQTIGKIPGTLVDDLVHAIGKYFNTHLRDIFPYGINLNFVKLVQDSEIIEHRCFERGIEKETLACGTGMVASAYLLHTLRLIKNKNIRIYPFNCRRHKPGAEIKIDIKDSQYLLYGMPVWICSGMLFPPQDQRVCQADRQNHELLIPT